MLYPSMLLRVLFSDPPDEVEGRVAEVRVGGRRRRVEAHVGDVVAAGPERRERRRGPRRLLGAPGDGERGRRARCRGRVQRPIDEGRAAGVDRKLEAAGRSS